MRGSFRHFGRQYIGAGVLAAALLLIPRLLPAALIPFEDGLLGHLQQYQVKRHESLIEVARKFDVGYNEIVAANAGVDPFVPGAGTSVTIPTAWLLPSASSRPSVIINLPEFRLYYLPKSRATKVLTFPLGIGDQGTDTPLGSYHIIQKIVKPDWHVPKSIRKREPFLPKVMPAGPNNPMGSHALRLSSNDILIHGTDRPWGIGRRSSHGCLRLYPEDIVKLFKVIPNGMRVLIVDQPVKIGTSGNRLYLEAHRKDRLEVTVGDVVQRLADEKMLGKADFAKLMRAMEERRGIPVDITLDFIDGRPLKKAGVGGGSPVKQVGAGGGPVPKQVRNPVLP